MMVDVFAFLTTASALPVLPAPLSNKGAMLYTAKESKTAIRETCRSDHMAQMSASTSSPGFPPQKIGVIIL